MNRMVSRMSVVGELYLVEAKLFIREPVAVFFTIVFPVAVFLLFGFIFGEYEALPGFRVVDVNVPAIMTMAIGTIGLMGLPVALSEYREQGVFKRFRASPVSLSTILLVHVMVNFTVFAVASIVLLIIANLVFGIHFAGNALLYSLGSVLCASSLFTMGMAVGGIVRGSRTAQAVGSSMFFPMLFLSGAAIQRNQFPEWLQRVSEFIPMTHMVDFLTWIWIGAPQESLKEESVSMLIIAVVFAVSFIVAIYTFRWSDEV